MVRRTPSTAEAVVVATALLAGCSSQRPMVGTPVSAVAPTRAPATAIAKTGACSYAGEFTGAAPVEHGLVAVGTSPTAVAIEWLPGFNQRVCRAVLTRSGRRLARELAAAVDAAPDSGPGMSACPSADDMAVELFFVFPGHTSEQAGVDLSGCEGVGAPGRSPRQLTDRLDDDLGSRAPPPWRRRLVGA